MGLEDKSERALFPWVVPLVQEVLGGEHSGSSVTALGPNNPLLSPRDRPCTADTCSKREVTVHAGVLSGGEAASPSGLQKDLLAQATPLLLDV